VRRSRDRFWKSEKDQDKWDAYHTLYGVLFTLSKLMAPFTPFFAEVMYQNLAGSSEFRVQSSELKNGAAAGSAPSAAPNSALSTRHSELSVHLCDYPVAAPDLIDESLAQEMDLVRDIVSLGRAARTNAKLKVRQPLGLAEIVLVRQEHAGWLAGHADLIAEELNIKHVEFTTQADQYVTYQIKPEFKALGPKFGKLAPRVAAEVQKLDAHAARQTLSSGGALTVYVDGQSLQLTGDEVQVRLEAKPGWSAAQGRAGVIVVKTELTPELIEEGVVRELVHHVQGVRKDLNLAYEARITLRLETTPELQAIVQRHVETLRRECLVDEAGFGAVTTGEIREVKVEGHATKLAVEVR
jgi:isoleucyl-tRNA synthetase